VAIQASTSHPKIAENEFPNLIVQVSVQAAQPCMKAKRTLEKFHGERDLPLLMSYHIFFMCNQIIHTYV
jgi:hypothetical protein